MRLTWCGKSQNCQHNDGGDGYAKGAGVRGIGGQCAKNRITGRSVSACQRGLQGF